MGSQLVANTYELRAVHRRHELFKMQLVLSGRVEFAELWMLRRLPQSYLLASSSRSSRGYSFPYGETRLDVAHLGGGGQDKIVRPKVYAAHKQ
jgi:hypothetical protein